MLMTIICVIAGIISSALITILNDLCSSIGDIWIPALLFLGCTVCFAAASIVALFIATLFVDMKKPVKKPSKVWFFLYNVFNEFLVFWAGINLKITENEKLGDGPYLFVINHRSDFDTMLLSQYYKKYNILMVSKPGNFKIPIAGPAIKKSGFFCMPKDDPRESLRVVNLAADYLKEGKYSVGVCPEGTRNKKSRDLLPFKNGCFKMAVKANVPIVVFCVNGTEEIHKNFPFKRTKVYLDLLKVITPDDYKGKSTTEIGDYVRDLMLENINFYKPLAGNNEENLDQSSAA